MRKPDLKVPHLRWIVCALLFAASTINYVDRQAMSVLKPHLQDALHWSESDYGWIVFAFQLAYALMFTFAGRAMDWLGTRIGYAISITWWSAAAAAHALARGALSFGAARFLLGAGEAGNFPAAIKAVTEWFPKKQRAFATGIFNAGPTIGAVLAPPLPSPGVGGRLLSSPEPWDSSGSFSGFRSIACPAGIPGSRRPNSSSSKAATRKKGRPEHRASPGRKSSPTPRPGALSWPNS